ncbi:MAG: hypothetical protein ACPGQL_05545 [Thermoplasmatota archaeon]
MAALLEQRLPGRDASAQKFLLAATLNECLPAGAQAILVGGSLVELLTLGAVTSMDLDLVADRRIVGRILQEAGFEEKPLAFFRHPRWDVLVNTVSPDVGRTEKLQRIAFEDHVLLTISAEDALIDRLNAAVHWDSKVDRERAILLARTLAGRLDLARLRARAAEERIEGALEELLELVG